MPSTILSLSTLRLAILSMGVCVAASSSTSGPSGMTTTSPGTSPTEVDLILPTGLLKDPSAAVQGWSINNDNVCVANYLVVGQVLGSTVSLTLTEGPTAAVIQAPTETGGPLSANQYCGINGTTSLYCNYGFGATINGTSTTTTGSFTYTGSDVSKAYTQVPITRNADALRGCSSTTLSTGAAATPSVLPVGAVVKLIIAVAAAPMALAQGSWGV